MKVISYCFLFLSKKTILSHHLPTNLIFSKYLTSNLQITHVQAILDVSCKHIRVMALKNRQFSRASSSLRFTSVLTRISLLLIFGTTSVILLIYIGQELSKSENSKLFISNRVIVIPKPKLVNNQEKESISIIHPIENTKDNQLKQQTTENLRREVPKDTLITSKPVEDLFNKRNIPDTIEKNGVIFDMRVSADYVIGVSGKRDMDIYNHLMQTTLGMSTVLLIMASNRPEYLHRCLTHVLKYHPRVAVPIVVSEDGNSPAVAKVVAAAQSVLKTIAPDIPFLHIHHTKSQEFAENGYIKLSRHFKWALNEVFNNPFNAMDSMNNLIQRVIILEEDLEIASDFYEYFGSLTGFADFDDEILAISAWNDNGQKEFTKDSEVLYRSDFFPGLGWMMSRKIWEELNPKWPKGYWDDWLREPNQRKGRHIIRPEICRTFHFGAHGVSNSQYSEYLNKIKLNDKYTKFFEISSSYLEKNEWDKKYIESVKNVPIVTTQTFHSLKYSEVSIRYDKLDSGSNSFVSLANWAGIMDNIKANVPRTAYRGIVTIWKDGIKLHIAPNNI